MLVFIMILSTSFACQQVKEEDVTVNQGEEINNLDEFKTFVENVENGDKDTVRIAKYTTEGDPIFLTLEYNGKDIKYTYDNSQDEYAGSDKGKKSTTCADLESSKIEDGIEYHLSDCSSDFGSYFDFKIPK
ncbi:DUF4362 domain-containing protein [Virgibacillus halodenitrificans]|uniref:DUF4362 domain-containing protein n=1 Tax=Virgibacillus halodenitrificans TaxID=1482 RepID=UPI000EF4A3E1|nr:DUF4362 domain-containing protein [Virgibacillus halodenitrificans]